MKKLIPLLLAVFALTACEKDADTDKLDNKFVVYTNYDKNANFKQFNTYYLPDSILIIGDKDKQEYWKDANAQKIIDTYSYKPDVLKGLITSIILCCENCKSLTLTYSTWTIEDTPV